MSYVSIERVTEITEEVLEATLRLTPLLGSSNQGTITTDYLERTISNPDTYWLMARRQSDGKLIGMASLVIMALPTNIRANLENVVVDASARGLGVGKALCNRAREIADDLNVNTLRAATSPHNLESQAMLINAGFKIDTDLDYFELDIQQGPRF